MILWQLHNWCAQGIFVEWDCSAGYIFQCRTHTHKKKMFLHLLSLGTVGVSSAQVALGVFDRCLYRSPLLIFEPVLEFFVFPPGGVALTGLIQSTQTNCSTTPAATVSKPPLLSVRFLLQHQTHLSPWLPCHTVISMAIIQPSAASHTCLHGYHLACWCPWLRPRTAPLYFAPPHE